MANAIILITKILEGISLGTLFWNQIGPAIEILKRAQAEKRDVTDGELDQWEARAEQSRIDRDKAIEDARNA